MTLLGPSAASTFAPPKGRAESTCVLVVEDEQIVALELQDSLVRAGYDVPIVVASGEEALDVAEELRPDLVMMDIKLQGQMDGITAAEILRKRGDVPVIFLTAFADQDTLERAKQTAPYGYILKPFRERELCVAVEMALSRHQENRRQRFLAEVGREVTSSLDRDLQIARLTSLVVRHLADWCVVHLQDEGDKPLRIHTFTQARSGSSQVKHQLLGMAPQRLQGTCVERALVGVSTRERVQDERTWLASILDLSGPRSEAAGLRAASYACVPLMSRGRSLGALTAVLEHPRKQLTEADLRLLEEVGRLAGAGIENARLYGLAQRAVQMREDILGIVSQDLQTPIWGISLAATLLLSPDVNSSPEKVADRARRIGRNADNMNRLVKDLLDLVQVDSGQLSLCREIFSVDEILQEATAMFEGATGGADLQVEEQAPDILLSCDRERILQVFSTLLGNAIKHSEAGKAVRIGAVLHGGMIEFHVTDETGSIQASHIEHLFEPYWRGPGASSRGLSLGLHIARGVIEAHGGRLWVETTPGAGSTFRFTLPWVAQTDTNLAPPILLS